MPPISSFIHDTEATCSWENENNFTDVKDFGTIEKWLGLQKDDPWIASDILVNLNKPYYVININFRA